MKDIFKNPILYYFLVPIVVALWPLLVGVIYLPDAKHNLKDEMNQYENAKKIIDEILTLDPGRLESVDPKKASGEFDYAVAVEKIASLYGIPSANYSISSSPIRTTGGQKTQNALLIMKDIEITRFAKFLATIQLRWASLQCEKITLTKNKGLPDSWKVDLNFRYYY
jgi:hypothetical protein